MIFIVYSEPVEGNPRPIGVGSSIQEIKGKNHFVMIRSRSRSDFVQVDGKNLQAMECGSLQYVLATIEPGGESGGSPLP
jgi:hypothetical protein